MIEIQYKAAFKRLYGALHWCYHDSSKDRVRIWRPEWTGDSFEVLSVLSLEKLKEAGFNLIDHND